MHAAGMRYVCIYSLTHARHAGEVITYADIKAASEAFGGAELRAVNIARLIMLFLAGSPVNPNVNMTPDNVSFAIDGLELDAILLAGSHTFDYAKLAVFKRFDGSDMRASGCDPTCTLCRFVHRAAAPSYSLSKSLLAAWHLRLRRYRMGADAGLTLFCSPCLYSSVLHRWMSAFAIFQDGKPVDQQWLSVCMQYARWQGSECWICIVVLMFVSLVSLIYCDIFYTRACGVMHCFP